MYPNYLLNLHTFSRGTPDSSTLTQPLLFLPSPEVARVLPDVVEEDLPEELAHEAVDEEVDAGVDHHQQLRDGAGQEDVERDCGTAAGHVALVLVDREHLENEVEISSVLQKSKK